MDTKYYAKDGALFNNEKAQIYGERIAKLTEENNNIVTSDIIVKDAKKKSSPLHGYFEWNDNIAAIEWRRKQAGYLVRSIKIEVPISDTKETVFVRAFHNIQKKDNEYKTRGYAKFEYVQKNEALYDEFILKKYLAEIKRVNNQYKIYKELDFFTLTIDKILTNQVEITEKA